MRKISIINYKGGTGKTSTVVNLGHGLALEGKKVLIVDTDPQGSAGYCLGVSPPYSLYDVLIEDKSVESCVIQARENLDILAANERLYPAELKMSQVHRKEFILSEKMAKVEGYDFVLLDCAPSMNLLNQNALLYASELLVPVSMEWLSLMGVKQLLNNVKIINRMFGKAVVISKVVPTFFDKRNNKSKEILESLERVFPHSVSHPIRVSVSLSEAPGCKQTIFEYDPNSNGAADFRILTQEVLTYGQTKEV